MKKKKKIKIIVIIIILAFLLIGGGIALYIIGSMLFMKPAPTGVVRDTNITAIKNANNDIYLVETEDGYILMDSGSNSTVVMKSLEELAVSPENIRYVLLTHSDYDHVAAAGQLQNAIICINQEEKQMIDGTTARNGFSTNSIKEVPKENIKYLSDGEKLNIGGFVIECIAAPGHTPGSMVFLLNDQYLFTGDAFAVSAEGISVHPFTMDEDIAKETIEALSPVIRKSKMILTAHYGYYNVDSISK